MATETTDADESRRITDEINAEPDEAERLRKAREQARSGRLITQAELDAELRDFGVSS